MMPDSTSDDCAVIDSSSWPNRKFSTTKARISVSSGSVMRYLPGEIVDETVGEKLCREHRDDRHVVARARHLSPRRLGEPARNATGRASCRERVCQYVSISVVAGSFKKKKPKSIETKN